MKKLLLLFLIAVFSTNAFGVSNEEYCENHKTATSGATNLRKWESLNFGDYVDPDYSTELPSGENPCIGTANCNSDREVNFYKDDSSNDEWGKNLMVAVEATVGGAKFCPVTVGASNSNNYHATWLGYKAHSTDLGKGKCIWLCREGYAGDKCEQKIEGNNIDYCDYEYSLQKSDYSFIEKGRGSIDIKNSVSVFSAKCIDGSGRWYEGVEGLVLISDWLTSGNGAKIRAYRAYGYGTTESGEKKSILRIIYNGNSQLGCKRGYKPNEDKTDCVPIDVAKCGDTSSVTWCGGWDGTQNFDTESHTLVTVSGCSQWRCSDSTKALKSVGAKECVDCSGGANPEDGTCMTCPAGSYYDKNANDTNEFGVVQKYCVASACSGWSFDTSGLSASSHVLKRVGNCYQWRCKTGALEEVNSSDCSTCTETESQGVVDGICHKCSGSNLFDVTATSSNYCVAPPAWCPGWLESTFTSGGSNLFRRPVGNCSQWRCKSNNKALNQPGGGICETCGPSADMGINPYDGTCKQCPNGMFFSAEATDETEKFCVASWCSGWDSSRFDSSTHVKQLMGNCYQWRCKSEHRVLTAPGSADCVRYSYDSRTEGVNPENGMVVKCSNGKFFDENAVNAEEKYCVETISLSNEELGQGGQSNALNACWAQKTKERYINCITSFIRNKKLR